MTQTPSTDDKKLNQLLNLLEHPEQYTEAQKDEILADKETREIYEQIVLTRSALDYQKSSADRHMPSVNAEWQRLKRSKAKTRRMLTPMRKVAAVAAVVVVSGMAFAAIHFVVTSGNTRMADNANVTASANASIPKAVATDITTTTEQSDTTANNLPLVYENAELQSILSHIASHFHLQVRYENESARHIRLYLQLRAGMTIDDIVELMNHFEKINIRHEADTLIVE